MTSPDADGSVWGCMCFDAGCIVVFFCMHLGSIFIHCSYFFSHVSLKESIWGLLSLPPAYPLSHPYTFFLGCFIITESLILPWSSLAQRQQRFAAHLPAMSWQMGLLENASEFIFLPAPCKLLTSLSAWNSLRESDELATREAGVDVIKR